MQSRYDNPAYQEQVSKQMLATPTHEIACRAITDLRERVRDLEHTLYSNGAGTIEARFDWFLEQLKNRFPNTLRPYDSSRPPEVHFLRSIDERTKEQNRRLEETERDLYLKIQELEKKVEEFQKDSIELNALKVEFFNMITGRTK